MVKKYTDKDRTEIQAVEIEITYDKEEMAARHQYFRQVVNPRLTWLYEISYLDAARKTLFTDLFDIRGNFIRREEPWRIR